MKCETVVRDSLSYPRGLELYLGDEAPAALYAIGNPTIMDEAKLALFCSGRCPGRLIVKTYDAAQVLRDRGYVVISGFHSPMEQECLNVLIRSPHPLVACPARGIEHMRVPAEWRKPIAQERLLVLSPFDGAVRRPTVRAARFRNRLAAAMADAVLLAHAAPGSKLEKFAREVADWGIPLYTLADEHNRNLLALGAVPFEASATPLAAARAGP